MLQGIKILYGPPTHTSYEGQLFFWFGHSALAFVRQLCVAGGAWLPWVCACRPLGSLKSLQGVHTCGASIWSGFTHAPQAVGPIFHYSLPRGSIFITTTTTMACGSPEDLVCAA